MRMKDEIEKTRTYLHFVLIVDAKTINLTSRKDDQR